MNDNSGRLFTDCLLDCVSYPSSKLCNSGATEIAPGNYIPTIDDDIRQAISAVEPTCTSSPSSRTACAIQAYDAITNRLGETDCCGTKRLRWEVFVSLILRAEGGTLLRATQCFDNSGNEIECSNFVTIFENQAIRNLRGFAESINRDSNLSNVFSSAPQAMLNQVSEEPSMSGAELLFWLAGLPGASEGRGSGIEGWYGVANPVTSDAYQYIGSSDYFINNVRDENNNIVGSTVNCGYDSIAPEDDPRCGQVNFSKLLGINRGTDISGGFIQASDWHNGDYITRAINAMNRTQGQSCTGCVWGNFDSAQTGLYYAYTPETVGNYGAYFTLQGSVSTSGVSN